LGGVATAFNLNRKGHAKSLLHALT
jgi:hypothetical protein